MLASTDRPEQALSTVANDHRLATALEVAERAEQESARILAQCRGRLAAQRMKVDGLKNFLADYSTEYRDLLGQVVSAHSLGARWHFISRLNDAIGHEEEGLARLRAEFALCTQQWTSARSHAEGLRKLRQRDIEHQLRVDGRREQAAMDEFGRGVVRRAT
jgi:flagellar export protein FliJ